jgi:uncharacterized protein YjbI with pentapeptide repeats
MNPAYGAAMLSVSRELAVRGQARFPGTTVPLTGGMIMGFTIEEGADEALLPGSIITARCRMELANTNGDWLPGGSLLGSRSFAGAEVLLEMGVNAGQMLYAPCGTYAISGAAAAEGSGVITLTGLDRLTYALNGTFDDSLVYPCAIAQVLAHILGQTGLYYTGALACNGDAVLARRPIWGAGCTLRYALKHVLQACGSFLRLGRDGTAEILPARIMDTALTLGPSHYTRLEYGAQTFRLARVRVVPSGAASAVMAAMPGAAPEEYTNTLTIRQNPLFRKGAANLQAMVDGLLEALNGMEYREAAIIWRGSPEIRAGTRVNVTDTRGETVDMIALRASLAFAGGLSGTLSCPAAAYLPARIISANGGYGTLADGCVTAGMIAPRSVTTDKMAEGSVDTDILGQQAVTEDKIAVGAITADNAALGIAAIQTANIADAAITSAKIALLAVDTANIRDLAVTSAQIDNAAITGAKIADATITATKIADATITSAKITDATITAAKIADAAITGAKIVDATITAAKIADATITAAKIVDATITAAKIENAAIGTAQIALGAITQALIASGAVGVAQIADASITDAKIVELTANKINAGTLSVERLILVGSEQSLVYAVNFANGTPQLSVSTIDGGALTQRSITADRIVAGAITAGEIAAATILANHIAAGTITGSNIAAGTIEATNIKAGTITGDKLLGAINLDIDSTGYLKIKSGAAMEIQAGGDFNLNAGSGSEYLGISTNGLYRFFAGAAASDGTDAKYSVSSDGSLTANDANIRGEITANGSITFGDGITVAFANDAARIAFLAALFAGAFLTYSQGGTNAASRAGALANLGLLAGIAEVSTITAQNIADRYLLMLPGTTVTDNSITPSRAGYYCVKSSAQKKTNVHTTYQPLDGGDSIAPTDTYSNWYDTSTPKYGAVTSNGSVYCYNKAGTATNSRTGTATVTVTYQTIWGYQYRKTATSTPYYLDYTREVYWAECPAPVVGDYNSAAVKTAVLTFTRSVTTSATYNLYYGIAADGFTSKTLIGSVTTATASIVFSLLEQTTLFRSGTYYLFLERDGTYETSAITISAASVAFTYYTGAKRTEEYAYNGTEFAFLSSGAPYLQVPFIDGSNADMTISATSTYGSSNTNNLMAGTGDGWISNAYTIDTVPTLTLTLKVKLQQITLVLRNRNNTNYVPELMTIVAKDGSTPVTTKAALTNINISGNAVAYATHIIRLENALPADVITIAFAKISMNYTSMGKIRVYGYLGGGSGNTIVI